MGKARPLGTLGDALRFTPEQRAQLVAAHGGEDNFKGNILSDVLFTRRRGR
jgi:hypothetical protein